MGEKPMARMKESQTDKSNDKISVRDQKRPENEQEYGEVERLIKRI